MGFLPTNYQPPASSNGGGSYFKIQNGANRVRILGEAIVGYVYWNNQNKPVRTVDHPGQPADARIDPNTGKADRVKYFWACVVWDYAKSVVSIWEITQTSIRDAIEACIDNPDYGDPLGYDLTVNKIGEKLETKYSLIPSPPKPVDAAIAKAYEDAAIDLTKLYSGGDPYANGSNGNGVGNPNAAQKQPPQVAQFESMMQRASDAAQIKLAIAWFTNPARIETMLASGGIDDAEIYAISDRLEKQAELRLGLTASTMTSDELDKIPF